MNIINEIIAIEDHVGCCCVNSEVDLMARILQQDRDTFVRLGQVLQALGRVATGSLIVLDSFSCSSSTTDLLNAILQQRTANFNRLQQVIVP